MCKSEHFFGVRMFLSLGRSVEPERCGIHDLLEAGFLGNLAQSLRIARLAIGLACQVEKRDDYRETVLVPRG